MWSSNQVTLSELPQEVHELIIDSLQQTDRVSLSSTNSYFNTTINRELYKNITIDEDYRKDVAGTHLGISKLAQFSQLLSGSNFKHIKSITIQVQSNLELQDYSVLYDRLYKSWDSFPQHQITVKNYDTKNVRHFQSLSHYVYEHSCYFLQEEDCSLVNLKINNLRNWLVSDFNELLELPYNQNLRSLKLLIEKDFGITSTSCNSLIRNLAALDDLYLSTPVSTRKFFEILTKESDPFNLNLKSLAISWSHSHTDNSKFTFSMLSQFFNLESVEKLEIKVNCIHHGCHCINEFFNDMCELPNLKQFVLVNYNSNSSTANLSQFHNLLTYNRSFYQSIKEVESICINISDCFNSNSALFDVRRLMHNLNQLKNVKEVIIPDYFKTWQVHFLEALNKCQCDECGNTRNTFNQMAQFDASNNYKHEFKKFEECGHPGRLIESSKISLNFFNYLISNIKKQFVINIYSTNSVINLPNSFVKNEALACFIQLFVHSAPISHKSSSNVTYNLGGIII